MVLMPRWYFARRANSSAVWIASSRVGGEDQDLDLFHLGINLLDRRDAKRRCLSGPGLGLAGDVIAGKY